MPVLKRHRRAGVAAAVLTVVVTIGPGSSRAAFPSDPAGTPFVTYAHAIARGDYPLACTQIARVTLMRDARPRARTLKAARKVCARKLSTEAKGVDEGRRAGLASTRVARVRVKPGRARVTVQTTLYGVQPRSTGSAIVEDRQWKIARPPSGAHVGSSLVFQIPSESMLPTLRVGDTILVDQAAYREVGPRIGDIVVFRPPEGELVQRCGQPPPSGQACATATRGDSPEKLVKRIVARPGDRVSIRDGHVIRNAERVSEDFITPCGHGDECDLPRTFTVAAGRYYVLGDNRGESYDSRYWGPVPARSIIGRVRRLGP